jgi:hypothetical protein
MQGDFAIPFFFNGQTGTLQDNFFKLVDGATFHWQANGRERIYL